MANSAITFHSCRQDSRDFGSDDDHMVSRISFGMVIRGKDFHGLTVDVKQTVGSDFLKDPIELGRPVGYTGPLNYEAFRHRVEGYYRSCFGPSGSGISIGPGVKNIRMGDNVVHKTVMCEFDVEETASGW